MKELLKSAYAAVPMKKELFTLVKKFWSPPEPIYRHLHFKGRFVVQLDEQHSFKINHYGYLIENEIFWDGLQHAHEKVSYRLWTKLVRNAEVILDIGANTGVYSLIAKALNPVAQVYALEPVRRVYQKLCENNELNGYDIVCLEKAASNKDGTAVIYDTSADHTYSVTIGKNLNAPDVTVFPTQISTVRLDSLLTAAQVSKVDLLKIDVETHEAEVLEGLGNYLELHPPTMLVEILNDEVGSNVEKIVKDKGYLYFNIDDKRETVRQVSAIKKSDFYNYLLCSEERARYLQLV